MKPADLLKRTPTVLALASLSYACYSVHGSVAPPTAAPSSLAKGLDVMVKDVLHAGADEMRGLEDAVFRDPFRSGPVEAPATKAEAKAEGGVDHLAEVVKCLTLDATFVQGRAQIAIISGREYHRGQHLIMEDDTGKSYSQLYVASVQAHSVTLGTHNKTYELLYPDTFAKKPSADDAHHGAPTEAEMTEIDPEHELAFYKRLANGPLGKLGKSLTGIGGPPSSQGAVQDPKDLAAAVAHVRRAVSDGALTLRSASSLVHFFRRILDNLSRDLHRADLGVTQRQRQNAKVVPMVLAILWRLLEQEKLLQAKLPGYAAYCQRLRYRLKPFLW